MKRKRWLFLLILGGIAIYGATYGYLRHSNIFIHRAGKYDFVDRFGERHSGRHFIQPGGVQEGAEIFAIAVSKLSDTIPLESLAVEVDKELETLNKASESRLKARRALFFFFRPIAAVESLLWYLIDPDPLASGMTRQTERAAQPIRSPF